MSQFNYFSLSVEKGLRGNIGKLPEFKKQQGKHYADMMLFLLPNGNASYQKSSHIVNVHFPCEMFLKIRTLAVGDYVRIYFDRIDLSKSVSREGQGEMLSLVVKANSIEIIREAMRPAERATSYQPQLRTVLQNAVQQVR